MISLRRIITKRIIKALKPVRKLQARYYKRSTVVMENCTAHLFFHSLCIDAQLSFRADNDRAHDFESWFVTVSEFKEILERMYFRGYCLVDIHDVVSGVIDLPEGKKPLVLSFDDVNYYDYMKGYGFASKMILTPDNRIANTYISNSGEETITYEGDCVPIIESFIEMHPDFSHNGARGVIAVTGKEGILGYRNPEESVPLVHELKKRGWLFASHSWRHNHSAYSDGPILTYKGKQDIGRWKHGVEPFTGETDIFITPFGVDTRNNPGLASIIKKNGFKIICTVSDRNQIEITDGVYYYPRISVDGVRFSKNPHILHPYIGNSFTLLSPFRKRIYPDAALTAQGLVDYARLFLELKSVSFDSCGLIKHYCMGGMNKYRYVKAMDLDADALFSISQKTGQMDSLPEIPGICLYMKGYIAVYEGKGYLIECLNEPGNGYRAVETNIADRNWSHWFHMPWISYEECEAK